MASNEEKAAKLIQDAEKKLASSKGFFASLFGGTAKVEDAIECYQRAANMYKMARNWDEAGSAFCKAALLHNKAGSRHDAATNYVDAANCYKKTNADEAQNCLLKAIEIYTDMGRFTMAAKHHQTIAEIYENDSANYEKVVQHYEQAADYYRGEESNSSANKCLLKVAQYAAELENYEKAINIYQQVAS
ncbi:Tetratricopeptide repeat-containing protein, partial [Oryctes borbonicus]